MFKKNIFESVFSFTSGQCMVIGLILSSTLLTGNAVAEQKAMMRSINADAVTGWNRRFEEPIHLFGDIGDFGFSTLRIRNPEGGRALPITRDTPLSSIVSTYFDVTTRMPILPQMEGFSLNSNAPSLNDMPVVISRDGITRTALKSHLQAGQMEVSRVGSDADITLGEWLQAKGKLTIQCNENGENWLHIRMSRLVPNRHYSLWEWYAPAGLEGFPAIPSPVGGIGSDIMSDSKGFASYSVQTNHCLPLSIDEESPSRAIMAIMHWDHQSHASVPIAPLHPEGRFFS
jgi:hypothetical protein